MYIQSFLKDIWRMLRDNKWIVLISTVVIFAIFLGVNYFIRQMNSTQEQDSEENQQIQVGTIDIYSDREFENISFYPSLPNDLINEIYEWEQFSGDFTLSTNGDSELDFSNEQFDPEEPYNPLESFLGLEDIQRQSVLYDEETGEYYMTVRVDPENGNMTAVGSHYGVSDYLIDLNINDTTEESTFDNTVNDNVDSIMDVSFGMDPGGGRLARFETYYNWQYGVSFPRSFSNERNFYVFDPTPYNVLSNESSNVSNFLNASSSEIIVFLVVSLFLSTVLIFVWNILNKKINYSFSYGWSSNDLYLQYDETGTEDQLVFNMLQSKFDKLVILSEEKLPENIISKISNVKEKDVQIVHETNELSLNKLVNEFTIVIQRGLTHKEWYNRQRKLLKAYRDINIKIIEI